MHHRRLIIAAISIATVIKVCLAVFTFGTNDVVTWQSFITNIHRVGGAAAYEVSGAHGDPFNHPPFMIHLLLLLDRISRTTQVAFPTLFRALGILADVGTVLLVYRMNIAGVFRSSHSAIIALAFCPVSILISGFHGNSDPVMIFLILASAYLLLVKQSFWAGGLAFGMAINIKLLPLLLVSVFFFYGLSWRRRVIFFTFAALIILIGSMPYLAQNPIAVIRGTLLYKGFPAAWGLSNFLHALGLHNELPRTFLRVLIFVAAMILPYLMNRRGLSLNSQIGVVLLLFLFLTPSFGVQYLAWPVPFILSLELGWVVAYYISAGTLLFTLYHYWSAANWYFAESHVRPSWNSSSVIIANVCWLLIGLLLVLYHKQSQRASDREHHSFPLVP